MHNGIRPHPASYGAVYAVRLIVGEQCAHGAGREGLSVGCVLVCAQVKSHSFPHCFEQGDSHFQLTLAAGTSCRDVL